MVMEFFVFILFVWAPSQRKWSIPLGQLAHYPMVNGFVATFLKLLSSNLVCKPHLSVNLNLWSQNPPTPSPGVPPRGRGGYILGVGGLWPHF